MPADKGARALAGIPATVARRAVEWLVELESSECDDAARRRFQSWREAHPDHERAWRHIEQVRGRLQSVRSPLVSTVAQAAVLTPRSIKRRDAIKSLVALFFVAGGAWAVKEQAPWQDWSADQRTGIGERRTLTLDDGSTVILNTDSAVDLDFSAEARRLRLIRGEMLVTTAADRRPFLVDTPQGRLRPLGTRFAVRDYQDRGRLDVFQGAVEIRVSATPDEARVLQAGERAFYGLAGVEPVRALGEGAASWVDGMLVANNTRLADFLVELERYRPGILNCDPAIAGLRLSGTYPLADTDRILMSLSDTLPVRIRFMTRYWVRVTPSRV